MRARLCAAITMAIGLVVSSLTGAAPLTLTGAELYANSAVTFPTIQPTLNGSSLVFGPGGQFVKLMVVDLPAVGIVLGVEQPLTVTVNFTRLAAASGQPWDFDPYIFVGDGSYLLGASIADNISGAGTAQEFADSGTSGSYISSTVVFGDAGYPPIDGTVEVDFAFKFGGTVADMTMAFGAGSGSHTFSRTLNVASGLDLILLKDNDGGEQYQVNFITLDAPSTAPEPSTLSIALLGLAGLAATRRRRQ